MRTSRSRIPGLLFSRIVGSRRRHDLAEQCGSMGGTMDEGPSGVTKWIPGLRTVRTYDRRWTRADVVAGVVLAAILVPQGLAYAELAGLPPVTGLYTSIGCLVGYAVFGPSKILVLGPDSSISPLIFAALVPLLAGGDEHRAIALAGMLAVIVALIEVGLGIGRLGFVADLLSSEVQVGYMNGLALIIIVGQLPKLFGFSTDAEGFGPEIKAFVLGLNGTVGAALLVGLGSWPSCWCCPASPRSSLRSSSASCPQPSSLPSSTCTLTGSRPSGPFLEGCRRLRSPGPSGLMWALSWSPPLASPWCRWRTRSRPPPASVPAEAKKSTRTKR